MTVQHSQLAAGFWQEMSLMEQMANIGSEVERALNWRKKNNPEYARLAAERALELMDLTLDCHKDFHRLKEIARTREALVDYFFGINEFSSTEESWKKYFLPFALAARRGR